MKKIYAFIFCILLAGGCFQMYGPIEDLPPSSYGYHSLTAVTITKDSLKHSVHTELAHDLHAAGKIYIYKNYLFVVESHAGIHIYDNADPHNPANISFIAIPGCGDIAVKDNTLYADNAIDLVAINISDPRTPAVTARMENVFPEIPMPTDYYYYYPIRSNPDPSKFVTIDWKDSVTKR